MKSKPRKVWKVAVGQSPNSTFSHYHYLTNDPSEASKKALAQAKRDGAQAHHTVTSISLVCELD